jgi:hypothetical protein
LEPYYTVVGKCDDAPWRKRKRPRLGQDGLYYDESGAIVARGNGQDLGEFDLLLTSGQREIAFAEVKNSSSNLKEFDTLIDYKKRLLNSLFSQPVQFVLISSIDLSKEPAIQRIASTSRNFFVVTGGIDELHAGIKLEMFCRSLHRKNGFRPTLLSTLDTTKINYLELHDLCREELINASTDSRTPNFAGNSLIVKRLVLGYLNKNSVESLLSEKEIIFQGERLTSEKFSTFSRAVLTLSMPELRPVLYLRLRMKPIYLKMGPITTSIFKFERNIRRRRTAFFDWLERAEPEIGPDLMNRIMNKYLNDDVTGSRRKLGESPDIV